MKLLKFSAYAHPSDQISLRKQSREKKRLGRNEISIACSACRAVGNRLMLKRSGDQKTLLVDNESSL